MDSPDPVPEKDMDRMHVRDNLKIATVSATTHLARDITIHPPFFRNCVFFFFPPGVGPTQPQQGAGVAADRWQSSQRGGEVCQGEGGSGPHALERQDGHHSEGG